MANRKLADLIEWLTLREAFAALSAQQSQAEPQCMERARAAIALAGRAVDPANPLREGDAAPLALSLYAQASYWLLRAMHGRAFSEPSFTAAFAESEPQLLLAAAEGDLRLARLREVLASTFVTTRETPPENELEDARNARSFALALLGVAEGRASREQLERRRALRWAMAGLALLVAFALLTAGVQFALRTPDLARGKPWRASSTYETCSPAEHSCAGGTTDIFFHTKEEDSPWVELDLGAPTTIGSVVVVNRSDCCAERGYPIVVELSGDAQSWREVAKRTSSYDRWTAKFPPEQQRYVRVRALKRTYLHLEAVEAHVR